MAADLAVQPMPEKLEGKPGEASTLLEVQAQSELQEQMAESGKGKHEEPETIAAEVEKPSGAKLAALLPYPDKFHAAAKLAGAPLHEETGLDDAHRLMLYALFRQATDGPCNDPRPSVFDPAAAAKHMAYSRLGNMNPLEVRSHSHSPYPYPVVTLLTDMMRAFRISVISDHIIDAMLCPGNVSVC
jgi:acyl-CoA-binding protein